MSPDQAFIEAIKANYQTGITQIKAEFLESPNNKKLFRQHTRLVDGLISQIWKHCGICDDCCMLAVGGYGRGELYPFSDLDLLILLSESASNDQETPTNIEKMVGFFWDIGLNIGHSVRTIQECVDEAKRDLTTQTNLIECRLITGSPTLFKNCLQSIAENLQVEQFIKAKTVEQSKRYAKYNDTAYKLEPNIKESPGALRDIHSILWMARSYLIGQATLEDAPVSIQTIFKQQDIVIWKWLRDQELISKTELRHLLNRQRILQTIRIFLHFVSNRREDRLLFDFQNDVAQIMGFKKTDQKRASERLMQRYFRSVKSIQVMNEILLKTLQNYTNVEAPIIRQINDKFFVQNELLQTKVGNIFQTQPSTILEAFLLLQRKDIIGMSASLLRQLLRVRKVVNRDFTQSAENKKRFIEILSQPSEVSSTLRAMNRYGVLGAYIPAFGKIVGQMQHDLFHVYTVDEHTLHVLSNLERFNDPEFNHEFPLCSRLFQSFKNKHLLYLGAMFHDIAKGRNGDHSELGKVDARKFSQQHGLSPEDTDLVAWLVESHLLMSSTAQKSDLSDPKVVETFAKYVQSEGRLTALYLLTVADIRGTSPQVWNDWKAKLLETLFTATSVALKTSDSYRQNVVAIRRKEATERLVNLGLKPSSFEKLWDTFGPSYFDRHKSSEAVWHSRLLTPHLHTVEPIVRSHLSPNGDGIQIMIYEKVQHDIFARLCNFFDRLGLTIAEAKIFTTDHGYALNTFIVLDDTSNSISYNGLNKHIETELTKILRNNSPLEPPLEGRMSRQVKLIDYPVQLEINEAGNNFHQLEIAAGDKPGLLAKLAKIFIDCDIDLQIAKINTMGDRAEDTFIISARKGKKLTNMQLESLQTAIKTQL